MFDGRDLRILGEVMALKWRKDGNATEISFPNGTEGKLAVTLKISQ